MTYSGLIRAPDPLRARAGMPPPRMYSLRSISGAYAVALLLNAVVLLIAPPAILVSYPASGIALSRFIARRVIWWRQANSLRAVASNNVRTVLTWPIAVPAFLANLAAAKLL